MDASVEESTYMVDGAWDMAEREPKRAHEASSSEMAAEADRKRKPSDQLDPLLDAESVVAAVM
eukprot:4740254-Amphidinium_carterae.2